MIANAKCGRCVNDCAFCTQSVHYDTSIDVFPLREQNDLAEEIRDAARNGAHRFGIVTGGDRIAPAELDRIAATISESASCTDIAICASLGTLGAKELRLLRSAGLTRFHHNLETSESFYPCICTTQTWRSRYETILRAKEAGLQTCSGALFGIGETWVDRVALADTFRELGVDSVPINFLDPRPGTPLADQPPLDADEALQIVALYRLLLPETSLRICGGRARILGDRQPELFAAGADALMSGNYLTTSGVTPASDREMIESLGLLWE